VYRAAEAPVRRGPSVVAVAGGALSLAGAGVAGWAAVTHLPDLLEATLQADTAPTARTITLLAVGTPVAAETAATPPPAPLDPGALVTATRAAGGDAAPAPAAKSAAESPKDDQVPVTDRSADNAANDTSRTSDRRTDGDADPGGGSKGSEPKGSEPKSSEPKSSEPKSSESGDSQSGDSQSSNSGSRDSEAANADKPQGDAGNDRDSASNGDSGNSSAAGSNSDSGGGDSTRSDSGSSDSGSSDSASSDSGGSDSGGGDSGGSADSESRSDSGSSGDSRSNGTSGTDGSDARTSGDTASATGAVPASTGQPVSGSLPSQLIDTKNWYLTLPTGKEGNPDIVEGSTLAGYHSQYYQLNAAKDGVVFTAGTGGATTSGSQYPRSELREMSGSQKASWDGRRGRHTMEIVQAITETPGQKPDVIAGQIHATTDDLMQIHLSGQQLRVKYDDGQKFVDLDPNYRLGTMFDVKIESAEGRVKVWYNGQQKADLPISSSTSYFKAGVYTNSNPSKGDGSGEGQVVIRSLDVRHT
jgi:Alginate lyase